MDEQLCLKWNNHSSAIDNLLINLHLNELYSDVTILCQGNFYPVHRFVLSTCSEYFHEMFMLCKRMNKQHPFIIIKDLSSIQMEAMLNYMYKGEVNVTQSMLPDLLKAAETFKIKGLAVPDDAQSNFDLSNKRSLSNDPTPRKAKSRKIEDSLLSLDGYTSSESTDAGSKNESMSKTNHKQKYDSNVVSGSSKRAVSCDVITGNVKSVSLIKEEAPDSSDIFPQEMNTDMLTVKEEPSDPGSPYRNYDNTHDYESEQKAESEDFERENMHHNENSFGLDMNLPLLAHIEQVLTNSKKSAKKEQLFYCSYCSYKSTDKSNRNRHVKTHTGEASFSCKHCSYTSIRKYRLVDHMKKHHQM